jgi:hypothetical protein
MLEVKAGYGYTGVGLFVLLLTLSFVPQSFALNESANWTISYFVPNSSPPPPCSTTSWSTFAKDGGGFANPSGNDPVVNYGSSICITLSVSGDTADKGLDVWVETDGGSSGNLAPTFLFTVSSNGNGSGSVVWNNAITGSGNTVCTTPIKVAAVTHGSKPSQGDFDGHIADHAVLATSDGQTCTIGVPEFPSSSAGFLLVVGTLVPLLLIARRRWLVPSN